MVTMQMALPGRGHLLSLSVNFTGHRNCRDRRHSMVYRLRSFYRLSALPELEGAKPL